MEELPVLFLSSMVEIMNIVSFLFMLGFAVSVIGFAIAQILCCRFVKCYYRAEGFDCDLLGIHTRGAYAELAMISGYLLAVLMGIFQIFLAGSWYYLILCLIGYLGAIAIVSLTHLWEVSLRRKAKR